MDFRITGHAEREIVRRGIPREFLEQNLAQPQQIVEAYAGRKTYQSRFDFGGGRTYLLRAIVSEEEGSLVVVTAYRTSKISKYWRTS
jgi:hypothetical protein